MPGQIYWTFIEKSGLLLVLHSFVLVQTRNHKEFVPTYGNILSYSSNEHDRQAGVKFLNFRLCKYTGDTVPSSSLKLVIDLMRTPGYYYL